MLAELLYTSSLTPGVLVVDKFYADGRPRTVRTIQAVEELVEGLYLIGFADGGRTRSQGDERWLRA